MINATEAFCVPLATFGLLVFSTTFCFLVRSRAIARSLQGNVVIAATVAMRDVARPVPLLSRTRTSFGDSPSDTRLSFGFGRHFISTEVLKLGSCSVQQESRSGVTISSHKTENGRISLHAFQEQQQSQQQNGHVSHRFGHE